ncbi:MAG: hypothetical protein ACLQRH_03160 [Acidimicrobiales bacterium]
MGGSGTENGADPLRPTWSRPHWWVVLAVSLSLLALVAAAAVHDGPAARRHGARAGSSYGQGGVAYGQGGVAHPRTGAPASTKTTTGTPGPSPLTVTSPTSTSTSTSAAAHDADSLRPVTPESTTTTTPPSSTTTTTQAPPPPAPTEAYSGSLQQPNLSMASYPFSGVGPMQVSASWSPASTPLSVTVTCPEGSKTMQATTTVTVAIPDADGACEATIEETLVAYEAVSYTLTIGPAQGG